MGESQICPPRIWEWYWNISQNSPNCLISARILRTSTPVKSKTFPEFCNALLDASCGHLTKTFDRFKRSLTAGAKKLRDMQREPLFVPESAQALPGLRHHRLRHSGLSTDVHDSRREELWGHSQLDEVIKPFLSWLRRQRCERCSRLSHPERLLYRGSSTMLHGSHLLAAVMARWPSSCRFES